MTAMRNGAGCRVLTAVAVGIRTLSTTPGEASAANDPARTDFGARAHARQPRVDSFLSVTGGSQVSVNRILLGDRGEILLTLPGGKPVPSVNTPREPEPTGPPTARTSASVATPAAITSSAQRAARGAARRSAKTSSAPPSRESAARRKTNTSPLSRNQLKRPAPEFHLPGGFQLVLSALGSIGRTHTCTRCTTHVEPVNPGGITVTHAPAHDTQVRPDSRSSAEDDLDLVIGELEQQIPDRSDAAAGTCIGWYCV